MAKPAELPRLLDILEQTQVCRAWGSKECNSGIQGLRNQDVGLRVFGGRNVIQDRYLGRLWASAMIAWFNDR